MANVNLVYEQPLNEQIRLCLRLEYLFAQFSYYLGGESPWNSRQAIISILEILQATDRPDLKNKLSQALSQYASSLMQLEKIPGVDKEKLSATLMQIDQFIDGLHINPKKIGQELRENEFLMMIQQRLYTPAGTCNFSMPSLYLWLEQERPVRQKQLSLWFDSFRQLREIINLMLKLTRESGSFKTVSTVSGFYQCNLDSNIPYQMIRIGVAKDKQIFPEISVGKHRLAIHFFAPDANERPTQAQGEILFELACCKI